MHAVTVTPNPYLKLIHPLLVFFLSRSDTTLQAIVYKLVPGLYERELMRKRAFYKDRPEEAALATPEQRGDDTEHLIFSPSDDMSLSLEYAELGYVPYGYKHTL